MVRLKLGKCSDASYIARFQFQHGAIKAEYAYQVAQSTKIFQFQHGAIKAPKEQDELRLTASFQFQHGAIKARLLPENATKEYISIPTWCD